MTADIVILVGTDHHPFSRLIEWSDSWARDRGDTTIFVQHGYSVPPRTASAASFLTPDELIAQIEGSRVVITHGGPGTIMDARTGGRLPIVVPRDPRRGEHVDDHQQRFARWAAQKDLANVVTDTAKLRVVVEQELAHPTRVVHPTGQGLSATDHLSELIATHKSARARGIRRRIPTWQRRRTTTL